MRLSALPSRFAAIAALVVGLYACGDSGTSSSSGDATTDVALDSGPGDADAGLPDGTDDTAIAEVVEVVEDAGPTPTDLGSVPDADLVIVPGEDSDGDGISDADETEIVGTDPQNADSDGDLLIDGDELAFGSNPLVADSDGDGLSDGDEWLADTRPDLMDSDGDGFTDGIEISEGTDPLDPFSWSYEGGVWTNAIVRSDGHYGTGWEIDEILPNANLRDQSDAGFDLWQLYGNVVLLDFSAGWCNPCMDLAETAQELWETYRAQGFMVVHLITETTLPGEPADLNMQQAWAAQFGLEFPVVRDPTGDLYSRLSTQQLYTGSLPFMLVLDRDMRIHASFGAGQEAQLTAAIESLLPGEPGLYPVAAPPASEPLEGSEPNLCDMDGDGVQSFACGGDDCHDHTPLAGPEADELCDRVDWNCDGYVNLEATDAQPMYMDADEDGAGDPAVSSLTCADAYWPLVSNADDCDDTDPSLHPDTVWYQDADEDGYGNPDSTLVQCEQPDGYVDNGQDTDDGDDTSLGCWSKVTVGRDHTCGLKKDGTIDCWGNNSDGELLYPAGSDFIDINSGYQHTCAQKSDGTLFCWGSDSYGASTAPDGVAFQSFTCGLNACCGLTTEATNNVVCWGQNTDGQTDVPDGTYIAASIGGGRHACAVTEDEEVVCWGKQAGFQGGASPTAVVPGTYEQVSAAHYFTCALSPAGEPTCWGGDKYGQASPPDAIYTSLLGGTVHACGLKSDQTLACWGSDSFDRTNCPPGEFVQLDVNQLHSCAVGADGLISCWGLGDEGQTTVPPCNP